MKITRITDNNAGFFESIMPEEIMGDPDLIRLGVISDEGDACACAAFIADRGTMNITWIFTDPEDREKGAATALLKEMISLAETGNLESIEITYMEDDENMEEFLMENNFLLGKNNCFYNVPIGDMVYSEAMDRLLESFKPTDRIVSLTDDDVKAKVRSFLSQNGIREGLADDLAEEYSMAKIELKEGTSGCLLLKDLDGYDFAAMYMISRGKDETVVEMIRGLYSVLVQNDRDENNLLFADPGEKTIHFIEMLTGNSREDYLVDGIYNGVRLL